MFAKQYFSDFFSNPVCRLCDTRKLLEEGLAKANDRHTELMKQFLALQEFVTQNVAVAVTELQPTTSPTPNSNPPPSPTPTSNPPPSPTPNSNPPPSPTPNSNPPPSSTPNPTPHPSPPTPLIHNTESASSQQDTPFTAVTNGAKHTTKKFLPTVTISNRFQILAEPLDDPQETRLIGDSIVRDQLQEFCGRAPTKRKRFCIPGAGVDHVIAAKDEVTTGLNDNSLLVIHVGTNDVERTRSEDLLQKYRKLIQQYKSKTNNIIVSGVLPRISANTVFYSKAFSLNNCLKTLCQQEGIDFTDNWNQFYQKPDLFRRDGLHLSPVGSARLGRLLSDAVASFRSKNLVRQPPTDPLT
ncbi:MAG: hypothetical protein GY777_22915 [Candidatus Brocadiaceae bacterium]|nr:hypothetical protein [Candidatus Brocadiaceae bacterium]